ncbi:MAG: hypothetical protein GC161_06540 [Planctomycetaceae bacterium]|nr:hypothetical protein [Planctomycetaceae bacterium]
MKPGEPDPRSPDAPLRVNPTHRADPLVPEPRPGISPGDRAFFQLVRLKLRGSLRRQWRRMRQPKGLLLSLFGAAMFGVWLLSVLFSFGDKGGTGVTLFPEVLAGACVSGLLLVAYLSGLGHPGVYVPPAEVERLLSAPVTRGALLRHRVFVAFGRALPGLAVFGLLFAAKVKSPPAAIVGLVLGSAAVALAQQTGAIVAVFAGKRPWLRASGWVAAGVAIGAVVALVRDLAREGDANGFLERLGDHAVFAALSAPGAPLAEIVFAPHLAAAARPALLVVLLLVGTLVALCTVRVDLREATLRTATKVDERLSRMRRGVLIGSRRSSDGTRPMWRAPWWAGQGPAGAVVWSKSTGLVRRSPWTFAIAALMLAMVVGFTVMLSSGRRDSALASALLITIPGTLYLCGTLRIDLREEIDRMELWKALPVSRRRLFVALVTPQWLAVTVLLVGAILARAAFASREHEEALMFVGLLPLGLFVWIALDNALFLIWPVRAMPGPGGSMQHVARATLFLLLRSGSVMVAAALAALAFWAVRKVVGHDAVAFGAAALVLSCASWFAVELGGRALHRFDPAEDVPE